MKVLFICNQNQNRSKFAEELFRNEFETRSAGLYNETPVTAKDLHWADVVAVMDEEQRKELSHRFPKEYLAKRIVCLDILDIYAYGQAELKELLDEKVTALLQP